MNIAFWERNSSRYVLTGRDRQEHYLSPSREKDSAVVGECQDQRQMSHAAQQQPLYNRVEGFAITDTSRFRHLTQKYESAILCV
jgi:hypothetical protein